MTFVNKYSEKMHRKFRKELDAGRLGVYVLIAFNLRSIRGACTI